ncbi:hypothetical protein ABTY96_03320 [Streptomyces sp. NPDC096057]|uniref:hypothetical protein n=1 Tax=Streptomyces sp. NPDC096057 TaxID=3155543 RepID=UPI00332053ED
MTQPDRSPAVGCLVALLIAIPLDVALIALAIAHPAGFCIALGLIVVALVVLCLIVRK